MPVKRAPTGKRAPMEKWKIHVPKFLRDQMNGPLDRVDREAMRTGKRKCDCGKIFAPRGLYDQICKQCSDEVKRDVPWAFEYCDQQSQEETRRMARDLL